MQLIALQLTTNQDFKNNLDYLKEQILRCENNSIILAPELVLSGFSYNRMKEAANFSKLAIEYLKELSENKTIVLTLITEKQNSFYNTLYIFNNKEIIHTQNKTQLFPLGSEHEYFKQGSKEEIKIIELNGIKIACLICFELRFPTLWEKIKGADIILNPSMWGIKRKDHYESISKALALVNQAFVLTANSADKNMAKGSGIISPFGNVNRDDSKEIIKEEIDLNEIKKVRKYINIGLDNE